MVAPAHVAPPIYTGGAPAPIPAGNAYVGK